jgi:uncharacterized membrane protein
MVANTLVAFGLAHAMIEPRFGIEAVGLYAGGLAAWFLGLATIVRRRAPGSTSFRLLAAQGAVFTVALVPMLLDDHWTTIVWALQGAALLAAAGDRTGTRRCAVGLLVVASAKTFVDLGAMGLDIEDLSFAGGWAERLPARLALYTVVVGALGRSAWDIQRRFPSRPGDVEPVMPLANLLPFVLANIEVAAWYHDHAPRARFAAISVLWGLWSISYLVVGFRARLPAARHAAIVLFFATAAKVVLFDLRDATAPYRIVSFLAVGTLLVGSSYLYYRLRDRFEAAS